ncbi:MAG: protein kinase [Acidobacteriota bacterium]|nr:protein kinase [Acidobacteriota bacterium]
MKHNEWQKVKKIFDGALKLAPDERGKFLDENCDEDKTLRRAVENLLTSVKDDSFMEQPAANEVASVIIKAGTKNLEAGKCFGHYEIVEQIGAGGMGEVYLAKDKTLDRRVAIKILNEQFRQHESNLQRFVREAKSASGLNHPNILVIHEIGFSDEANYIVSEFVEGKTLRELLKEKSLRLAEVLEISIQIAGALTAAHAALIVHRDIKPENIMIRPDGFVKILDFGLAKLVEQKAIGFEEPTIQQNQTAKGVILGTVNYMSPEQAKGEPVDAQTDIFSLGVVIYEMIAGQTPFGGDSMSETFANLINKEPQPLSRYAATAPTELQRIVSKMLRKNKDERYQTMKGLLADLKDLRETLAFDERLEKSRSPSSENATAILQATTDDVNEQTAETNDNSIQQIKRQKSLAAFVSAVLLVGAIGFGYYFLSAKKSASGEGGKKSLAVLPFVNASQDPNAEYLSDGITESIINNLSQLSGLKVMSRNSAFRFKNNQNDTRNIASQLGVETLVTGDIRQIGDKFVINVRLTDGKDDSQIWGNQYVKTNADVIAAQNEIAQAVASNLRLKLTASEQQQLAKRYTDNVEAYQLYLRGRFHIFKLTPPEIQKGMSYFQQTIEADPSYALAYVGLSDAYRSLALSGETPSTEVMPKAKAAANKALEIDDRLAEAHSSLSSIIFWYDWDWNAAENQLKRALELNPNNADAHIFYAYILSNTGRHAEALAEAKRAGEIDPLSLVINALEGQFLLHAGQTDEALAKLQKTFEMDSNFAIAHLFASSVYIEKEMYAEAVVEARKVRELNITTSQPTAFLCYALAKSGKQAEARDELEKLLKLLKERYVSPYTIGLIYNGLNERDETFTWLERGFERRDPRMTFLKIEPKWNNIRSEPRFVSLLKRMNFE